jgi:hypothetical protein
MQNFFLKVLTFFKIYFTINIFFITFALVNFRMLVFRPFINEVLVGKVRMCNSEGVQG